VDGSGNVYLTGETLSTQTTFPETRGPDLTWNGDSDAFVAKVAETHATALSIKPRRRSRRKAKIRDAVFG
jgi:hypothetical protein